MLSDDKQFRRVKGLVTILRVENVMVSTLTYYTVYYFWLVACRCSMQVYFEACSLLFTTLRVLDVFNLWFDESSFLVGWLIEWRLD